MSTNPRTAITALGLSFILAASPTASIAATPAPAQVNPFAVMSAFGSPASAAALCGNAATAVTAGIAVATQGSAPGCVLPVIDGVAPVGQELPSQATGVAVANNAILPALLVISGLAAGALLFALQDDDDNDDGDLAPISS
jgi:hypothetical protein